MSDIVWTKTDESPLLASYSLLPIIKSFLSKVGISISQADISLSGRILAEFSEYLKPEQRVNDDLAMLAELIKKPEANIIKLPNISASIPQLNSAISELRANGYDVPLYPLDISNEQDEKIAARYAKVLGSAVNPVLRDGNSDRRSLKAVKEYAKANPHRLAPWSKDSRAVVVHMQNGDFYENEKSVIMDKDDILSVKFISNSNKSEIILKEKLAVKNKEIIDATFLSAKKLDEFIKYTLEKSKKDDLLYSVHLKATMMKVSDPVIFGHFVSGFFAELFDKFANELESVGIKAKDGLKSLEEKIKSLPQNTQEKIKSTIEQIYTNMPDIAMVDSTRGITNLHVPSDVIIDASMPAMIRDGGRMWNKNSEQKEAMAVIPDRTYATVYAACIDEMKQNGALDVTKIGSVSNVGLMAKKAEEYGSHDKTFIIPDDGVVVVLNSAKEEIFKFDVENGDIFRMTQTKDEAIIDWIELAKRRKQISGDELIFWLDENRAHDKNILIKLKEYINNADEFKFEILPYAEATKKTLSLIRSGKNVIGATGNVLRDYLTDLFPILELNTSSKMLSVVPLLNGGGLFETGAGGSAPKIALQLIEQNHLRWDSLGEYLALIASLEHLSYISKNKAASTLCTTLNLAVEKWLKDNKAPKAKVGESDNRTSSYYLALYWAEELAKSDISDLFKDMALKLREFEEQITNELLEVQGHAVDVGGYYFFDDKKAYEVMRPSKTLNEIIG